MDKVILEQAINKQTEIGSEGLSNEELLRIFVTAVAPDRDAGDILRSFLGQRW